LRGLSSSFSLNWPALLLTVNPGHASAAQFCFAKGCFAARQRWTKALVAVRILFFALDLKAKLCRGLHGLEKLLICAN
jgi:hypothetical protein